MKRLLVAVGLASLLVGTPASASVGGAVAGVWNLVPGVLNVVNRGVHFIMDPVLKTIHSGLHGLAEGLTVDLTPSERVEETHE